MEDTTRISELLSTTAPIAAPAPIKMCKCGRGPWRKAQRNCLVCNREANTRYRESLKHPHRRGLLR
jgi:hypothetical protein